MKYVTICDGIIFVEGECDFLPDKIVCKVEYSKKYGWNQQLRSLDDIKRSLALRAKTVGANVIVNFKYGQKTNKFWRAVLFATDDNVNWYASGDAVILSNENIQELKNT